MLSRPHPVGAFTRRQLVSQMRPYAIFLALLILADQVIEPAKGNLPIFHQWPRDLLPILLGGYWLRGPYTIFWFVPCLMLARILFNLALNWWPDPLDRRWALLMIPVLLLAYGIGYVTPASPLGLLSVPMAMILLWVGALWPRLHWRNLWLVPLALLAGWLPTLNMKAGDYGWPLLSIGSGIATSLLIFRLSARIVSVAASLATIGRASLLIMYLHVAIIHYGTPYADKLWLLGFALLTPCLLWNWIDLSPRLRRWIV